VSVLYNVPVSSAGNSPIGLRVWGPGGRRWKSGEWWRNEYILPVHRVVAFVDLSGGAGSGESPQVVSPCRDPRGCPQRAGGAQRGRSKLEVQVLIVALEVAAGDRPDLPSAKKNLRFRGRRPVLSALNRPKVTRDGASDLVDEACLIQASMVSATPLVMRVKRIVDVVFGIRRGAFLLLPAGVADCVVIKLSRPANPRVLLSVARGAIRGNVPDLQVQDDGREGGGCGSRVVARQ